MFCGRYHFETHPDGQWVKPRKKEHLKFVSTMNGSMTIPYLKSVASPSKIRTKISNKDNNVWWFPTNSSNLYIISSLIWQTSTTTGGYNPLQFKKHSVAVVAPSSYASPRHTPRCLLRLPGETSEGPRSVTVGPLGPRKDLTQRNRWRICFQHTPQVLTNVNDYNIVLEFWKYTVPIEIKKWIYNDLNMYPNKYIPKSNRNNLQKLSFTHSSIH